MAAEGFNNFHRAALAFPIIASQIVRKAAFDIEREAKLQIRANGQIDTGFLLNSVYTVTEESSGYAAAITEAQAHNPTATMEPEIDRPPLLSAYVVVGANYGIYQEMGTVHQPARPYLVPAAERVRPAYSEAWRQLELRMRQMGLGI